MIGQEKLYRRISDAILARLAAGEFPIGSRLPTERKLADAYGVSRASVREAVVALEMIGVLELRKGSGIYVVSLGANEEVETLDIGAFELLEARRGIEAEVAALAAVRRSDDDLAELERLIAVMREPDVTVSEQADRDFHFALAGATGNRAMTTVVTDLWAMRERCLLARTIHQRARGGGEDRRAAEHDAVLAAVRAQDADGARVAMRQHLEAVIEHLLVMTENEEFEAVRRRIASRRSHILGTDAVMSEAR
ncbi:FadR/GntR family transcriptional regulator [Sphingomonas prati]|uniref:GntR family transcriptional repressor for pyruvate dehydrogenase complex n=1 Tax=Sphingomonas prati TaxID=1843237 RepID=A0A7W9BV94_9SPHN|nr:FadR/GntR family transcriptional regulator [Sphingomonas prati]MBB5730762.1 GntR family transcriptional repressor for pyruvate dehydrogenase complex [Sphingomonas prati]GGE96567.1 GntR family transcriptional regulator [Sphingomonas prati]